MRTCPSTARVLYFDKTSSLLVLVIVPVLVLLSVFLFVLNSPCLYIFLTKKPWCDAFWTFAPYHPKGHEKSIDIRGSPIYGIYQSNAVTKNFFAGKTSIGTDGASVDGDAAANAKKGTKSEDAGDAKQREGDVVRGGCSARSSRRCGTFERQVVGRCRTCNPAIIQQQQQQQNQQNQQEQKHQQKHQRQQPPGPDTRGRGPG